jgi:hypothetical protein
MPTFLKEKFAPLLNVVEKSNSYTMHFYVKVDNNGNVFDGAYENEQEKVIPNS